MRSRWLAALGLCCVLGMGTTVPDAAADETSAVDKLRILYSSRFTFAESGVPLITVEIMSGQREVRLSAKGGVLVRPDGFAGSEVEAVGSGEEWTIRAEKTQPAVIKEWTVVETLGPDDAAGSTAALDRWKQRGFEPRMFEVGTVFGVDGEMIDTREVRIAVAPVDAPGGAGKAAEIGKRFGVATSVHQELVRRPSGTLVAQSGATVVRNPSVLWFAAKRDGTTLDVADVPTGTGGSQLNTGTEDRRYWGSVYVTLDHDGSLVAVNAVPEDKLLAGLVPAEMFPDAPDAALEAQAIAARTELLEKIGHRNLTDPFLLCSSQQCQVYGGAGKEQPRSTRAVQKTRGLVIMRDGGGLADARYSASCGGVGEDNEDVWGGDPDPSLRGGADRPGGGVSRVTDASIDTFLADDGDDAYCGHGKLAKSRYRWTERIDVATLTARVADQFPDVGQVLALDTPERTGSGRVSLLKIHGDRGDAEVRGDLRIRRLLGGLKSTLFKITTIGGKHATAFEFRGAGFGHGVGMCQMGAIGMATDGKSHAEILKHYYHGTHLHKLY